VQGCVAENEPPGLVYVGVYKKMQTLGIDVSDDWVDVGEKTEVKRVKRELKALDALLSTYPPGTRVALEATGKLSRLVVERALAAGMDVRVVDPLSFSLYRRHLNSRAKTDTIDALALARFAEKEWDRLACRKQMTPEMQELKDLLELRETYVKHRTALKQSLSQNSGAPAACKAAIVSLDKAVKALDVRIYRIASQDDYYKQFLGISGVGPATAPALVWLFRAFDFKNSDQAVAFVGLDARVKESGKFRGERKLTKKGPAFIRRLAYVGANSLRRTKAFSAFFKKQHAKGLKTTAVNMILARRLIRVAFQLSVTGEAFKLEKMIST